MVALVALAAAWFGVMSPAAATAPSADRQVSFAYDSHTHAKDTPGWQVEKLGRGSQAGRGWVFRQHTPAGNPTGQQLRWHPGGGHHGPDPYWRVVGSNGDLGGIIR